MMPKLNLMSDDQWDLEDLITHEVMKTLMTAPIPLDEMAINTAVRTALRKFEKDELVPIVENM
jgi:hypothetical protein